ARILELKRRYFEDYCSDNQYAVSIKEDTAYLCLHSPKDHEGNMINTPYPEKTNTPYWRYSSARSSTKELFTPFKDPKREFRSSRKHFKTILDSRGVIPSKTAADAKVAIQEMAKYS
ncbi:hypothetical protein Tco_0574937, partial [Tanacetum coccineum]